jgi:putative ABC transport system permease protein
MSEIRALLRGVWRNRVSSAVAIVMVGGAAAVATATFSLADALLWRDLPYRAAEQLQLLVSSHVNGEVAVSMPDLTILRDQARGAKVAASVSFGPEYALTGFGEPQQVRGRLLTAAYFETLGVELVAGRDFRRDEERPGNNYVAILTDRLWTDLFGRRTEALGSALALNGRSYEIVGILPPHRDPHGDVDIYVPHQLSPTLRRRLRVMVPIVRLAGSTRPQFESELRRLTANTGDPEAAGYRIEAIALRDRLTSRLANTVTLLFGSGVALLTIAVLNLAVLSATRARQRLPEFSTRLALGAGRPQILALAALDVLPLMLGAAAIALPSSRALVTLLRDQYGSDVMTAVGLDVRALLFLAVSLVCSMMAAFAAASRAVVSARSTQRSVASSQLAAGRPFVIVQIAVSLALVIASALLAKSFLELRNVDPGFSVSRLYTTRSSVPVARYSTPAARSAFWRTFLERLDRGGMEAALTTALPLSGQGMPLSFQAHLTNGARIPHRIQSVSAGYFDVLDIPLREGRRFTNSDRAGTSNVVIVNERFAASLATAGPLVGQTVAFDFRDPPFEAQVVGIVADVRQQGLDAPPMPEAYFASEQTPDPTYTVVIESQRDTADVARAVRATLDTIDPAQSFSTVTAMTDYVERNLASPRIQAQLMAAFATVALLVAMAGLYGLLAYLGQESRREWALRMALGASPLHIQSRVLGLALKYSVVATIIGLAVVLGAGAMLKAVLYGVDVWDPVIVGVSAASMIATCLLAAVVPALRVREVRAADVLRA